MIDEVRERPSLSEAIADLKSLGVSPGLMRHVIRRFAVERDIVIEDVPILDADLVRFRKRRIHCSRKIWPPLDAED